jgi:hypothetical protein
LGTTNHSPAYVLQIKKQWRVVVPVRGKLTPLICPEEFPTQAAAQRRGSKVMRELERPKPTGEGALNSALDRKALKAGPHNQRGLL